MTEGDTSLNYFPKFILIRAEEKRVNFFDRLPWPIKVVKILNLVVTVLK